MLSALSRRVILRTPQLTSLVVPRSNSSVFAYRTVTRAFVTAPVVAYSAPKATGSAASTGKTSTTKTKKSTGKTLGKNPAAKNPAAKKPAAKKPAVKPKKVVVTAEDQPPKRPPTAYLLFYVKHQKNLAPLRSRQDAMEAAKSASKIWASMSDMEKKPFFDEVAELTVKYKEVKAKYDESVDPAVFKEINRKRAARGLRLIHRHSSKEDKTKVMSAYFRFAMHYQAQFMEDYKSQPGVKNPAIALAKAAGAKWREMSDSEKAPYYEAYRHEQAEQAAKEH